MSEQAKKVRGSLKGDSFHIGGAKSVGTITREMIVAMSAQIAKLRAALEESERRRVAEQENMNATVQKIKEQVLNLACRPTSTSSPAKCTDDDSEEEDDYIDCTP
ncbi:hypothetical protein MTR67_027039 [Solanum verrucosum]|uniref:Uncharacterized protein n=1 Tax=Solanum verrucosum TaxID=315347 RepID=A0AAF0TVC8_SOLVR|nr:hypothetical protein MTR67_027039 [Solanum verrucosum]